ncbi:MAG: hypothetical protein HC933_05120 [Pleurocapsa sp. SU_196_0]|nr:hypothetical protein [Pleurocapsa sp. SU_196_0]
MFKSIRFCQLEGWAGRLEAMLADLTRPDRYAGDRSHITIIHGASGFLNRFEFSL